MLSDDVYGRNFDLNAISILDNQHSNESMLFLCLSSCSNHQQQSAKIRIQHPWHIMKTSQCHDSLDFFITYLFINVVLLLNFRLSLFAPRPLSATCHLQFHNSIAVVEISKTTLQSSIPAHLLIPLKTTLHTLL